ncbi:MAG: response regulator receiver protein [Verrucomicrobia bacterium]|jgi:DNA-binding response OmpR family regulator|nr:response regulator receiver protein [Verrucomicrobiota bacterium]
MNILSISEEPLHCLPQSIPFSTKPSAVTSAQPRILYVEDDDSLREMGYQLLSRHGYDVDTASDGNEALTALHRNSYQLLVTDQKMPRLTGAELVMQIYREGLRLPVVITSDVWGQQPDVKARPYIAAALPKPFTASELLGTVKQVLDRVTADQPAELALRSMIRREPVSVPLYRYQGINE